LAGLGVELPVQADLDGREVVVAAAQGETFFWECWVGSAELREQRCRGDGRGYGLRGREGRRDGYGTQGRTDGGKVAVRIETGAGAVSLPLVHDEIDGGHDVQVGGGIGWLGHPGTMLGVGAVRVLWPKAVHDEAGPGGALGVARVGVAVLRRPREIKEIEVEIAGLGIGSRAGAARAGSPLQLPVGFICLGGGSARRRRGFWLR